MSRIDVVHKSEGVSITLADHGFSFSVDLSQAEKEDLIEQLVLQVSASTGTGSDKAIESRLADEGAKAPSRASC
ncbi:MAG: hypothetical protein F4153_02525 [Acidimicrobiia bacterium]|nr:hypothetical protein [Acidimicrobiia bacterium]